MENGKTKPNTTIVRLHQSKQMYYITKIKPGLVSSYDICPGDGDGLFLFWHFINLLLTRLNSYPLTYCHSTHIGHFFWRMHIVYEVFNDNFQTRLFAVL